MLKTAVSASCESIIRMWKVWRTKLASEEKNISQATAFFICSFLCKYTVFQIKGACKTLGSGEGPTIYNPVTLGCICSEHQRRLHKSLFEAWLWVIQRSALALYELLGYITQYLKVPSLIWKMEEAKITSQPCPKSKTIKHMQCT